MRKFGGVYLALALWRRLGLEKLLQELMGQGQEQVAWADVAAVLSVCKFCDVAELLAHLGLKLPNRSKIIENVVEKTGA